MFKIELSGFLFNIIPFVFRRTERGNRQEKITVIFVIVTVVLTTTETCLETRVIIETTAITIVTEVTSKSRKKSLIGITTKTFQNCQVIIMGLGKIEITKITKG